MYNNISWLASYPKSGSTWVRMFLNAFMSQSPLNINSAFQFAILDSNPALLQMLCPTSLDKMTHNEQFIYRPAMLLNMLKLAPTKRLCLKTHNGKIAADGLPVIPLTLSDTAVYIIRDPRDVCISLSHHLDYTIDETIAFMANVKQGITSDNNITDLLLTWSKHVESWTVKNTNLSFLVVRYEDLLSDPIANFNRILAHLKLKDLPNFESRFTFALEESRFVNLQKYEEEKDFVEVGKRGKFFRVGRAGQWHVGLSKVQARAIISDHQEMMEKYSYV